MTVFLIFHLLKSTRYPIVKAYRTAPNRLTLRPNIFDSIDPTFILSVRKLFLVQYARDKQFGRNGKLDLLLTSIKGFKYYWNKWLLFFFYFNISTYFRGPIQIFIILYTFLFLILLISSYYNTMVRDFNVYNVLHD